MLAGRETHPRNALLQQISHKSDTQYGAGYKVALYKLRQFEQDAPRVVAARFCTSIYLFLSNALCCGSDVRSIMSTFALQLMLPVSSASTKQAGATVNCPLPEGSHVCWPRRHHHRDREEA